MTDDRRRYPDAPVRSPGVRLPDMPEGMAYEPNLPPFVAAQVPPREGVAETYEASSVLVDVSQIANRERLVYKTHNRWRACDVYLDIAPDVAGPTGGPPPLGEFFFLFSVFVWAVSQAGSKTLVASGRMPYDLRLNALGEQIYPTRVRWIAAGRAVAERYEVTIHMRCLITDAPTGKVTVTVIAADEMTEPEDRLGSFVIFSAAGVPIQLTTALGTTIAPKLLEVVGVRAVNTAAAARYLMLFDTQLGVTAATLATIDPVYVFPMGAAAGSGFSDYTIRYRCKEVNLTPGVPSAPVLAISSGPAVYTAVVDGACSLTLR